MAKTLALIILVILLCSSVGLSGLSQTPDDGMCKLVVETQGYACEEHKVTTKDGYILSIQRVPVGRSSKAANKPPVLLQHGLMQDGATWFLNTPDESLAFILADSGYDVWIANSRGTRYSREHTKLRFNPDYWDWTWDELAAYDLPAVVQYIHVQTGQKLHYVGHSLGTLIAFACFSQQKLLNMIRSAVMLSPIAYVGRVPSPLTRSYAHLFVSEEQHRLGLREFIPQGQAASMFLGAACNVAGANCADLLTAFTGPNCCLNSSRANDYFAHAPQATSVKNMVHLCQMIRTGTIRMYDYGRISDNRDHYGRPTPPVYDMKSILKDVPLFLAYGGKDYLSDVQDVKALLGDLRGHDKNKLWVQYTDEYAHMDFVLGVNANRIVYDRMIAFFNQN